MQLKCPECESETFQYYADVTVSRMYANTYISRPDLEEWEEDFSETSQESCGECSQCQKEGPEFCENLTMFDPQRNRELMTKPKEQAKLQVLLDSSESDDEEQTLTCSLIECEGCGFMITDPEILEAIERDWN